MLSLIYLRYDNFFGLFSPTFSTGCISIILWFLSFYFEKDFFCDLIKASISVYVGLSPFLLWFINEDNILWTWGNLFFICITLFYILSNMYPPLPKIPNYKGYFIQQRLKQMIPKTNKFWCATFYAVRHTSPTSLG